MGMSKNKEELLKEITAEPMIPVKMFEGHSELYNIMMNRLEEEFNRTSFEEHVKKLDEYYKEFGY